ncbi:MAG: RNA polymerase sigma factor [Bacteroidales bacterium]|nr:RNA polymerase sigma factor [Bacteroidales bacterium]
MEKDYAKIVSGSRQHKPAAQRALYDELAPMAMGICLRYAPDREEARDLLQDGFVKIYEKIATLRQPEKLRSWAYNIMVNTCIQRLRRLGREQLMEDMDSFNDEQPLPDISTSEIMAAMESLTPGQRLVFNLCCIEGLSLDEAAAKLRSNNSNVRALLCKARRQMRTILNQKL